MKANAVATPEIDPFKKAKIVSHKDWIAARRALLAEEKAVTRALEVLAEKRQALPWERVERHYVFEGPNGQQTLADLFGDRSQLIVLHLMFAPGDTEACIGCSHIADHVDAARQHFEPRDVAFAAISRAPYRELVPFQKRMGWKFHWLSSNGTDFNYDYGVSFTPEQVAKGDVGYNYGTSSYANDDLPGVSVFYRNAAGEIFHTYSTYTRGLDILLGSHNFLDLTPKGRNEIDEEGEHRLRFHDRYEEGEGTECCGSGGRE